MRPSSVILFLFEISHYLFKKSRKESGVLEGFKNEQVSKSALKKALSIIMRAGIFLKSLFTFFRTYLNVNLNY